MPSHNEFRGYVCSPKELKRRDYRAKVRLDFNAQIESNPEGTNVKGFALRMFVLPKKFGLGKGQPEIGIHLRPEEWLDLIESMKQEYELMEKIRKEFDNLE